VDASGGQRAAACGAVMYVTVYGLSVRRTNIYLTETEQAALDARAAVQGSTRSDVVRSIVDRELNLSEDAELDAALLRAVDEIADLARVLSRTDPDLEIS
jgi:hypothetical protein